MIGADQDLQEKGVKKEEKTTSAAVVKAKAPPVSAAERFNLQPACRPLRRMQRSLPHRQILRRPLSFKGESRPPAEIPIIFKQVVKPCDTLLEGGPNARRADAAGDPQVPGG